MHEQIESCRSFCVARGWIVTKIVREVAPGVGPQRIKLARLIQQGTPRLVVATTECPEPLRLSIFRSSVAKNGSELVVVDRSDEIAGRRRSCSRI